jgi:hypothetical protein
MTELKLYKGRKPLVVSTGTLLDVMKAVVNTKGMEEKYRNELQNFDKHIEVHPKLVNAMKTFLHENDLHKGNLAVQKVVSSPPGSTSCFPKQDA